MEPELRVNLYLAVTKFHCRLIQVWLYRGIRNERTWSGQSSRVNNGCFVFYCHWTVSKTALNYWFIGIMPVYNVSAHAEGLRMKIFFTKDLNCLVENVTKHSVSVVCSSRTWEELSISKRCSEICSDTRQWARPRYQRRNELWRTLNLVQR